MKPNLVRDKSFDFAVDIIALYEFLISRKEFVLSRQLLRSGTSIGANVREAEYAVSKADFINKMSIALKEANETEYWLELLERTNISSGYSLEDSKRKVKELLRILIRIIRSSKEALTAIK